MAKAPAKSAKASAKSAKKSAKKAAKPKAKKAAAPKATPEQTVATAGEAQETGGAILHDGQGSFEEAIASAPELPAGMPPAPDVDDDEEPSVDGPAEAAMDTTPEVSAEPEETIADEAPAPVPEGASWAERITAARSAPVRLEDETRTAHVEDEVGTVHLVEEDEEAPAMEEIEETRRGAPAVAQATGDVTIPEQFLTIAIEGQWDDRMERVKPGRMGAALAGSVLLELAVHGKLRVQRDHFVVEEGATGDADLDGFAEQVRELGPIPTEQVIRRLGRRLTDRIRPWKERAVRRGWLHEERRKFLGLFPRSTTTLLDEEVQGKLQNRLVRMLAGGGNPDVKSIALLGLIQSAGLLGQMVPSSALAFNEKRISLLLSGRDPLHYRVDTSVRQVQDLALRTILADVRRMR
jgi:hypothetical protein